MQIKEKLVSSLSSLPPDHTMIGLGPITPTKPLAEEGTESKGGILLN